ncbi:hypothetical protein ACOSQ3_009855 [Xanthoceras sorbifolium]
MELLILSSALDPWDDFKSFNIDNICKLADKFYPIDFIEHKRYLLSFELKHYKLYIDDKFLANYLVLFLSDLLNIFSHVCLLPRALARVEDARANQ